MTTTKITMPDILTANTFYWRSGSGASQRRSSERKRMNEVKEFFLSLGFDEIQEGIYIKDNIEIQFTYTESCTSVYKHLYIYVDGIKKDIRVIKKLLKD